MTQRTTIIAVIFVFLSGLISISQVVRAEDTAAQRKEHEQAAEKRLNELNRKMDEVAAEARKAGGQTRDELNKLYDEFKVKQVDARKDLEELRKATNESWDKVKVEMNRSIEELNGLYEKAKTGSKKEKGGSDK